ncbi:hypothetical protein [Nonomuraea sp. NPDC023979]|uniref:hypothetical protein n=1 Tax=Nonomuraea sp. NPDC023979 TaxID=3154796 RepID=UPI0033CDCC21
MHIDYLGMLPASPVCEHNGADWVATPAEDLSAIPDNTRTVEVSEGTPHARSIAVTVTCKSCPARAEKTFYYVRTSDS